MKKPMPMSSADFISSILMGFLAPLDALDSMLNSPRPSPVDPFKDLSLGSPETDCRNIRKDFARAFAWFPREEEEFCEEPRPAKSSMQNPARTRAKSERGVSSNGQSGEDSDLNRA